MPHSGLLLFMISLGASCEWTIVKSQLPSVPVAPPPRLATSARLEDHLAAWERTMAGITCVRFELNLTRTSPGVLESRYTGSLLAMRPNYIRLRLDSGRDPRDFEAFIHDGKSLFAYNGLQRTITEHESGSWFYSALSESVLLRMLRGMTAKELKAHFEVQLVREDIDYIYLELKPVRDKDRQDVRMLRLALYQPKHPEFACLPAQVFVVRPNEETEHWKPSNLSTNISGISEKSFQFEEIPGFRFLKAPQPKLTPAPEPRPLHRRS